MRKSLFYKYFTICASIVLLSIIVLGLVLLGFSTQYFRTESYKRLGRNVQLAVYVTEQNFEENNRWYVDASVVSPNFQILDNAIDATLFLVDTNGKTLLCTEPGRCVHSTYLVGEEIMDQVLHGEYREQGRLDGMYDSQYYTVGRPVVLDDGLVVGAVFASTPASDLYQFLGEMLRMFAASALTVLIVCFIGLYFATAEMVKPLNNMVKATKSFANGDFAVRVPVESSDEIGQLATAFNNMAASLATQETASRSFVANVSHELKTPMTVISGFVDGILDHTIPPEKHDYYLGIVSQEVKRLSRLVMAMLNVAKIEAGETQLHPVVFDLNQKVCETIFNFEKQLEEKQVQVEGLDSDRIMVDADPDLIHQVVYNLIENAIKFINVGGTLSITYQVEEDMTYVGIKNTGEGIAKDDLPRVFDRFYKTDRSRSLDKKGVGLGLYIVKTVVNLHGGEIIVRSVEGEYCEFIFTIPTAVVKNKGKNRRAEAIDAIVAPEPEEDAKNQE